MIYKRQLQFYCKDRLRKERQTAALLARAAAEGYERGQADAQATVGAAQAEAAAREETLGATTRALKVALGKLKRVRASATSLRPWCRRTSIQAVRYIVMRGVFDEDFCDSAAAELRAKRHWVLQGGDARGGGGWSCSRHQLDLSKPVGNEMYSHVVRKFSSVLHFPVESHKDC